MGKRSKKLQSGVNLDGLVTDLRSKFETIADHRAGNSQYPLPDVLMSGIAMFCLKQPSLLEFGQQTEAAKANLRSVFKVDKLISDSGFRKVLDPLDWSELSGLFPRYYQYLKKLGLSQEYAYLGGYQLVSIDGVEHFGSQNIHCSGCLEKELKNGVKQYHHHFLGAMWVHPEAREVFALGGEPIQKQDGVEKNDCELAAVGRLMERLGEDYRGGKFLFLQDALFANGPQIARIQKHDWDFITAVKPDSKAYSKVLRPV
jgi:hypothetical protein